MAQFFPVSSLQDIVARSYAKTLDNLCTDEEKNVSNLEPVMEHLQNLSISMQRLICLHMLEAYKNEAEQDATTINEKHCFTLINLHSKELYLNMFNNSLAYLKKTNTKEVQKLTINGAPFKFRKMPFDVQYKMLLLPPYDFFTNLCNLTVLKGIRICDDAMLFAISLCCPFLKVLDVTESLDNISDDGICHLAGFNSTEEARKALISNNGFVPPNGCKNLRILIIYYTDRSEVHVSQAAILKWCTKLETYNVFSEIDVKKVLPLIHGCKTISTIKVITQKPALTFIGPYLSITDPNEMDVVTQTFPNIAAISLIGISDMESDKEYFTQFLKLPIKQIDIMYCDMDIITTIYPINESYIINDLCLNNVNFIRSKRYKYVETLYTTVANH